MSSEKTVTIPLPLAEACVRQSLTPEQMETLKNAILKAGRPRIHIIGSRWFQKGYGNTYHMVRIFLDGKILTHSGMGYGANEQYLRTAWEWLRKNHHVQDGGYPGTAAMREIYNMTWEVQDVSRERDL